MSLQASGSLNLVVLRVASPRVPSVGILISRFQTNQPPVGSPDIHVSLRQVGWKAIGAFIA